MPIRVAQIGTGNVGGHALRSLIANPDYDLTAVWVSSAAKAGMDAGELAGLDTVTGIKATNDLDEVLATKPDCAVYNAMADNRIVEALEDYRRQRAGVFAMALESHSRRDDHSAGKRGARRQLQSVRQRDRPRLRQ
jgi:hypothetical protein